MALLIARHGETALNVARVVQPADTVLSARGELQAAALGERLAREYRVRSIVSSDLPRALQTAERVARCLGVPVTESSEWRERNFGHLRGRAYETLGFDPVAMREAPEGGESLAQFEARVARACEALVETLDGHKPEDDMLVVTHGLVLDTLLGHHIHGATGNRTVANTALVVVLCQDRALRWALGPCTAHLNGMNPIPAPERVQAHSENESQNVLLRDI